MTRDKLQQKLLDGHFSENAQECLEYCIVCNMAGKCELQREFEKLKRFYLQLLEK